MYNLCKLHSLICMSSDMHSSCHSLSDCTFLYKYGYETVKMCIKMGHTHPLGVLHYSAMELVALFHSTEDVQCATHRAIKMMELQDEAIAIRAVAPSETHVKAYIMAVRGDPSNLNLHPQKRRENPTHLLITLTQVGNSTPSPSRAWWPHWSGTASACGGSPSGDWTPWAECTRRSPPPMPWGHQSGSGNPKEGDQEVTFPREGGWVPLGQPSPSPTPVQPDGGWVSQGPPPQPPLPASPNPDMGHLINTLAPGLHLGTPRINTFSGKAHQVALRCPLNSGTIRFSV